MAASTLVLLQQVEQQIKLSCALVPPTGIGLTLEDFFASDPQRRRRTLGHMAHLLREEQLFRPDFEERLSRFVHRRNEFVHNLWADNWRGSSQTSGLPSKDELERVRTFIADLIADAIFVRSIFRGLQLALMPPEAIAASQDSAVQSPFDSWVRYIPDLKEVLREEEE